MAIATMYVNVRYLLLYKITTIGGDGSVLALIMHCLGCPQFFSNIFSVMPFFLSIFLFTKVDRIPSEKKRHLSSPPPLCVFIFI